MFNKIETMLKMQFATNAMVSGNDWPNGDNDYLLAAGMEAVEIIEGVGWKWWKHTPREDETQLKLELVDIWHFLLGEAIRFHAGSIEDTAETLERFWKDHVPSMYEGKTVAKLKRFASACFSDELDIRGFINICDDFGFDFEDLYKLYIVKNTLVTFRNDHGYKTADYVKQWDGKEDNVHLIELANTLDSNRSDYVDALYQGLVNVYPGPKATEV